MLNVSRARFARAELSSFYGLPAFASAADAIRAGLTDDHIYALYPERIRAAAHTFLDGLNATSLYAVKANPNPAVIAMLADAGVHAFDVASIRELQLVKSIRDDAEIYVMHPVKSRAFIRTAYAEGARRFSLDCPAELEKILAETDQAQDLELFVRLSVPTGAAVMPLGGKFGASFDEAISLLQSVRGVAKRLGVCFHVGSQCMDPQDYRRAIAYVREVMDRAGVELDIIDIGGGFPVNYPGMPIQPLNAYFEVIHAALAEHGFDHLTALAEPGRALCAEGGSTLVRVEQRKGQDLYLNDGGYGSLSDAANCAWRFPVRLHRQEERADAAEQAFRFFGPTCDSLDVMEGPFLLPDDVCEGDWIEVENLGAYGQALAGQFNGFWSETVIAILTNPEDV